MLSCPVVFERLQVQARAFQVMQCPGGVQDGQLPVCSLGNRFKPLRPEAIENPLGFGIFEAADHAISYIDMR